MYVETNFQNSLFMYKWCQKLKEGHAEWSVGMQDEWRQSKGCKQIYCTRVRFGDWILKVKEKFVAIHLVYFFSFILGAELKEEMSNEQTVGYR